jgi:hypothetical protein
VNTRIHEIATGGVIPLAGKLIAATPLAQASFFGFYDICPWSPAGAEVVLLSCPAGYLQMPMGEKADVCVWTPQSNTLRIVAETSGWNWQHGARQRWLSDGSILFNDVQSSRQCSRVVSPDGRVLRTFDMSVSALHPHETYGVSANYARLAKLYSSYGYGGATNTHLGNGPDDDGMWRLDLRTGEVSLMLSYTTICDRLKLAYSPGMFITHPDFSPSGAKFAFFLIQGGGAGTSMMRLLVFEPGTDSLALITEEKASHPAWIDDNRLWVWARESSAMKMISRSGVLSLPGIGIAIRLVRKFQGTARNALLSEGFFIYSTTSGNEKERIAPDLLTEDGHFSRHPVHELMLGDTYPDATGHLTLILYSLKTGRRIEVARIFHGVATEALALRCDLHPRWNRNGTQISVDYCENGVRRMAIFDATEAIAAAGH